MTLDARWLVAAARLAPIALIAPPLGRSLGVRVAIAALLVMVIAPSLPEATSAAAIWQELLVGVALGVTAAVPFAAAKSAGALIDRAREPEGGGPLGTLFSLLALALFAAMNGPRLLVVAVAQSYAAFPVAGAATTGAGTALALEAGARLIGAGLTLAAPALAALVLVELMMGLVARAQPALAEAVETASLRTLALVIVLSLGTIALAGGLFGDGGLRALAAGVGDAARGLAR